MAALTPATRRELARMFAAEDARLGVEVGVERGHYLAHLARANPEARLYGVDPWKWRRGYREHVGQDRLDIFYVEAQWKVSEFPNVTLLRETSLAAVLHFDDGSLDFVYIDADHADLQRDLDAWTPKVRVGGIVAGHDYSDVAEDLHGWLAHRESRLNVLEGDTAKTWWFRV